MDKMKRRRMNVILDTVKFRKNKNAIQCFDDDCQDIKEQKIMSGTSRRGGDGKMHKTETDTGNIIVYCETHNWRELFSVSQLDNLKMPERTTSVDVSQPMPGELTNVVER